MQDSRNSTQPALVAFCERRGIYYGWIVVAVTCVTVLVGAGPAAGTRGGYQTARSRVRLGPRIDLAGHCRQPRRVRPGQPVLRPLDRSFRSANGDLMGVGTHARRRGGHGHDRHDLGARLVVGHCRRPGYRRAGARAGRHRGHAMVRNAARPGNGDSGSRGRPPASSSSSRS